ncbi:SWIM zinc finger family protein [Haladaptatus sp. DFWS20]|uniref:SWIM zinc finger family protein n=1 Tax=Haladaptatus sp. DFWS20 TaxID=3403467 RepID=UPI003EC00FA9
MTEDAMACTCPHHVHRNAICKHMAAVETATDDGTLEAFLSKDEDDAEPEDYDCDCGGLNGFPCSPCVRTGRNLSPCYQSL